MKTLIAMIAITAGIAYSQTVAAYAAPNDGSEFQISCPGRPTMTIDRAEYGISTLMWGDDNFQIAAGQDRMRLQDGQPVSITLFRNGDQLMVDNTTRDTFFVYAGTTKLVPCERTETRPDPLLTLVPWNNDMASGQSATG